MANVFELPVLIGQLSDSEWKPLPFVEQNGELVPTYWNPDDVDSYLRLECWIVKENQYLYTERKNTRSAWSTPKLGEHPNAEQDVFSTERAVLFLGDGLDPKNIHPQLREDYLGRKKYLLDVFKGLLDVLQSGKSPKIIRERILDMYKSALEKNDA